MEFNERLYELRKEKGYSQEELADKIGVTRQTISKWELAETKPDIMQAKELASIFGVSLDVLVGNSNISIRRSIDKKLIVKVVCIIFSIFLVIDIISFIIFWMIK